MARRKRVYKKIEARDSRYDSPLVARLVNELELNLRIKPRKRLVREKPQALLGLNIQVQRDCESY